MRRGVREKKKRRGKKKKGRNEELRRVSKGIGERVIVRKPKNRSVQKWNEG